MLLPDHDGTSTATVPPRGCARCATAAPASAATACCGSMRTPAPRRGRRRSGRASGEGGPEWFMDYRNARRLDLARCAATASASSPATSSRRAWSTPAARSHRHPRRRQDADRRRRPDHRRHGPAPGARRDQGRRWATAPGPRSTSTWATRTRSRSLDDLAEPGRLTDGPGARRGVVSRGVNVEFVVRRGDRARRDAGPRARLGRDPVVRHRRLRGGRGLRRGGAGAGPGRWRVDVPGGELEVSRDDDDRVRSPGRR